MAVNVAAALGAGRPKPFTYKTLGVFVDMGNQKAVAETVGIKWRGFPAWFLARSYHLMMMPGMRRRARLVTDWTVGLLCVPVRNRPASHCTRPKIHLRRSVLAMPKANGLR